MTNLKQGIKLWKALSKQINPVSTIPPSNSIFHTDIRVQQDNHFEGHVSKVKSVKQAAEA